MLLDITKSKYVRFHEQAQKWVHRLEAITSVLSLAAENKEAAAFLHPLYTKSIEVRRSLPKSSARFSAVFTEQQEVLEKMLGASAACCACTGWNPPGSMMLTTTTTSSTDVGGNGMMVEGGGGGQEKKEVNIDVGNNNKSNEDGAALVVMTADDDDSQGGTGGGGGSSGDHPDMMVELLLKQAATLERCLRDLRAYADSKRNVFPRFYFLSNRELLDVLANGKKKKETTDRQTARL